MKKVGNRIYTADKLLTASQLAVVLEMSAWKNPAVDDEQKAAQEQFFGRPDTPEWWEAVGTFVRLWRRRNDFTQEQLAGRAGINRETVIRLERGEAVKLSTLRDVTRALAREDQNVEDAKRQVFEEHYLKPVGLSLPRFDLPLHDGVPQSPPTQGMGEPDVPASERSELSELERLRKRVEEQQALIDYMSGLASEMLTTAINQGAKPVRSLVTQSDTAQTTDAHRRR